ncbi:MAG: SUMF1/EgtB/PvdO family nonheme iron enzyme [SAR324 cluster bacterium]|nr:SUMF1/EgtB/PvdO family nonheme iron enzyme [SAR324 cluster bacterium]
MGRTEVESAKVAPQEEGDSYTKKLFKPIPETPIHDVSLPAYYMDSHEVSNQEFHAFVNKNPEWNIIYARGKQGKADRNYLRHWDSIIPQASSGESFPVVYVSWFAADAYCRAHGKRLPTEAEWERSVHVSASANSKISVKSMKSKSWFYFNSLQTTHPVQSKTPNTRGIFHLQGNVWEWVQDWYHAKYYSIAPYQNPSGPRSGIGKVIRGGGWNDGIERLQATSRDYAKPHYAVQDIGFRCARSSKPQ